MSRVAGLLLACACVLFSGIATADSPAESAPGMALFAKPVVLRGTLGGDQVQLSLRVKTDFEDRIEGEYFVFGHSQTILLAGEIDGDDVFFEESENGTDVSGQWNGKLAGDVLSGEWRSTDGKVKAFRVRVLEPAEK